MKAMSEQVALMVKGCIEAAREHLGASATEAEDKTPTAPAVDIVGTREQILGESRETNASTELD